MTNTRSARQRLLNTAAQIVAQHGVQELTLEGVAAAAGVTKGGLIYHFKTKDALLGALVERLVAEIEERNRAKASRRGDTPAALLSAMVDDTFEMPRSEKDLLANLLSAVFNYPHLLEPAQEMFKRVYGALADAGAQSGVALVLAAALDGITLLELLNLHSFTKRQREAMHKSLLQLVQILS